MPFSASLQEEPGKRSSDADAGDLPAKRAKRGTKTALQLLDANTVGSSRKVAKEKPSEPLEQFAHQMEIDTDEQHWRTEGRAGQICQARLVDFMCHKHLRVPFGPHITFISGTNGSGKSAVLQAIQCCLGAKASSTARASSVKELIRTGCDEATLEVIVWNTGVEAYRPDVFGNKIIVERRIAHQQHRCHYLLKNCEGRVVEKGAKALDDLLEYWQIDAANPIAVQTQETTRNFLNASGESAGRKKYELVMQSTGLEEATEKLALAGAGIDEQQGLLDRFKDEYRTLQQRADELRKKVEELEQLQRQEEELALLENAVLWKYVDQARAEAAAAEAQVQKYAKHIAQVEDAAADVKPQYDAAAAKQQEEADIINNFTARTQPLQARTAQLNQEVRRKRKEVTDVSKEMAKIKMEMDAAVQQREGLIEAASAAQNDIALHTQALWIEHQAKVNRARAEFEHALDEYAAAERVLRDCHAGQKDIRRRVDELRSEMDSARRQIEHVKADIQNADAAATNKLAQFGGQPMVKLVDAITKNRRLFHKEPIGPLGRYLSMAPKYEKFAKPVEAAIYFTFRRFIVHDMHDADQLRQLARKCNFGPNLTINIYKFDIPQHQIPPSREPPPNVVTIKNVLRINHPKCNNVIFNVLVDDCTIEKVALCQTEEEHRQVAYRTPNVVNAWDLRCSRRYKRGHSETVIPPPGRMPSGLLAGNTGSAKAELEQMLAEHQAKFAAIQREHDDVSRKLDGMRAEQAKLMKAKASAQTLQNTLQSTLTQLQDEAPQTDAEPDGDNDAALQVELNNLSMEISNCDNSLRDLQTTKAGLQAELDALDRDMAADRQEINRLAEQNNEMLERYGQTQAEVKQYKDKLHWYSLKIQEVQDKADKAKRVLEDALAKVEVTLETAKLIWNKSHVRPADVQELEDIGVWCFQQLKQMYCETDANQESVARFEKRTATAEDMEAWRVNNSKVLERAKKAAGGSLGELQAQYVAERNKMREKGKLLHNVEETNNVLKTAHQLRKNKLESLCTLIEQKICTAFNTYMYRKGHRGKIKINWDERRLDMKVLILGNKGHGQEVKDLKQLSGGERSFTTVAFTLAVGQFVGAPFRAMDEFDVFMDAINRRVAMENLFEFAADNKDMQFIFLTPQDMAAVEDARTHLAGRKIDIPQHAIKVVMMQAARENATHI